jgi:hypothetical protein
MIESTNPYFPIKANHGKHTKHSIGRFDLR